MRIHYYFKKMATSSPVIYYTRTKLHRLDNLLERDLPIQIKYEAKQDRQKVQISCTALDKSQTQITVSSSEIYEAIDTAIDKIARALRKKKEKQAKRRTTFTSRDLHKRAVRNEMLERIKAQSIDAESIIRSA
jgi:ribosomal subunit interface protein